MLRTASLGYPRIGRDRQLKKATESFWKGELDNSALKAVGAQIRKTNWFFQKEAGIDIIPSNDFSFYDQSLDMAVLLGVIPARFGWNGGQIDFDTYFAMARGSKNIPAMEMTKWFDTNYHYIVPEFSKNQKFKLSSDKPFEEYQEARSLGIHTQPVLIGPVTFLRLGKTRQGNLSGLSLLDAVLPVYTEILKKLKTLGAESVQMDEPILVTDLDAETKRAYLKTYETFSEEVPDLPLALTTYFGGLGKNLKLVSSLPVHGLHVDMVRTPEEGKKIAEELPKDMLLSLGIVDGRNIWKNDFRRSIDLLKPVVKKKGSDKCIIASSCSLLHAPLDLELENTLDKELKSWFSFSAQKLEEIDLIRKALVHGEKSIHRKLGENKRTINDRKKSERIHNKKIKTRIRGIKPSDYRRDSPFKIRQVIQKEILGLPLLPTTTIGSFPQTSEVRQKRALFKKKGLSREKYETFLKEKIKEAVQRQIEIGLDVLVHGEPERNDMVEYFGEQLEGFAFTQNGWVQSYGTRYVKPPIIFGDVARPKPMTVDWITYAQSLTEKLMKGMLTGPITILQWSFVRDDQPRSETAKQIALAIRDEARDLEEAGIKVIQIDEPAIREGLPLRKSEWVGYLKWAVDSFRLASSGVQDKTQIHTHMCYSEFNDIIRWIAAMDADVISIETSRSQMELLNAFVKFHYPNEIGPGVYDIHSPRVPSTKEIELLLKKAADLIPVRNLWVNPDCGLKTRSWNETIPSLQAMVTAAKSMRESLAQKEGVMSERGFS